VITADDFGKRVNSLTLIYKQFRYEGVQLPAKAEELKNKKGELQAMILVKE